MLDTSIIKLEIENLRTYHDDTLTTLQQIQTNAQLNKNQRIYESNLQKSFDKHIKHAPDFVKESIANMLNRIMTSPGILVMLDYNISFSNVLTHIIKMIQREHETLNMINDLCDMIDSDSDITNIASKHIMIHTMYTDYLVTHPHITTILDTAVNYVLDDD